METKKKNVITIVISGGVLVNVLGLPDSYEYELIDEDNEETETEDEEVKCICACGNEHMTASDSQI